MNREIKNISGKKSQSFLQYALLIGIISLALVGLAHFFQGVISGKYKATADSYGRGEQFDMNAMSKYNDDTYRVIHKNDVGTEYQKHFE